VPNLDPTLGNFATSAVEFKYDIDPDTGERYRYKDKIKLETELCGTNGNFNFDNQTYIDLIKVSEYQCLKNKTYEIQGNFYTENFFYLEFKLYKCVNATWNPHVCQPEETIN